MHQLRKRLRIVPVTTRFTEVQHIRGNPSLMISVLLFLRQFLVEMKVQRRKLFPGDHPTTNVSSWQQNCRVGSGKSVTVFLVVESRTFPSISSRFSHDIITDELDTKRSHIYCTGTLLLKPELVRCSVFR
ncbi:hypothetical protein FGIG_03843 [Fasciola gigantica]|uniref:Uncharacterized protein n=1 Tax=Fasciola gigantica TaxID=46835 RepID=A0A504YY78_FASGI|nr:hypothetical protein FGIG_03843 [Fasciola gigantica]